MSVKRLLCYSKIIFNCCPYFAQIDADTFKLYEPKTDVLSKPSQLWGTYYYIHQFKSQGTVPILLQNGSPSGLFADTCDLCKSALEGTIFVENEMGSTLKLNFSRFADTASIDCQQCSSESTYFKTHRKIRNVIWFVTSGYGNGVKNYHLVPYRTIAVDPKQIPFGTVLYIPEIRGKSFIDINGKLMSHDGYFFAGDTGSEIKGNHIDFFLGKNQTNPFPLTISSSSTKPFNAVRCTDYKILEYLNKLHSDRYE